ncbi:hypothetical protein Tco_0664146 [Tanacetum coccineum]
MFLLNDMDQDSAHIVAASKVSMLKPGEYKIWRMRIEQYIQTIDYALWEVIENGATLPKTKIMEGVMTEMPIKTPEEKAQRRLEDAKKLLEAVEKRFGSNAATRKTQRNLLKQQYENFTGYKTGLESVEQKLEVYKENESIYLQDIKGLKSKIHLGEITIRELRKKLEIVQKEKDGIQLNVDKFEHASKSLNKLIECQIVDICKKGLGYESYNAIPPPYTRNFMPLTPDLSFTGLDEFVNEHVVENYKAMSSEKEPKVVRKYDDAPGIKEWVSDDEEEDVSQPKTKKKTVRPSIVKKEFDKSKQQEKTARKTIKQVEQHRQNTHSPRGNQ